MLRSSTLSFLATSILLAPACQIPGEGTVADDSTPSSAPATDSALATLCESVWEFGLESDPLQASYIGDPRYHGELPDTSRQGRSEYRGRLRAFQARLHRIDPASLSASDRITWLVLAEKLHVDEASAGLDLEEWVVDPVRGMATLLLNVAERQPVSNAKERSQLIARWNAMPTFIRQHIRNLRRGLAEGRVSSRTAIEKEIAQIDALLQTPAVESPLVQPASGGGKWVRLEPGASLRTLAFEILGEGARHEELRRLNRHLIEGERQAQGTWVMLPIEDDELSPDDRADLLFHVLRSVEREIYPAFAELRDTLATAILPSAREDSEPGIMHVAGGRDAYAALIRYHTSLDMSPQEIHEFGLAELDRIRKEMSELGARLFGIDDVTELQSHMRSDPELFFSTREEVEAKAVDSLERAKARMGSYFGRLPVADCEVVRTPAHEEAHSTIAYYSGPVPDGSRPGRYYINTYAPETRPRYDAEVLAFHEAIPGHHLQIAIAQELEDLPDLRKHYGGTAFVEGWALYTERLCDEMGLYSGDLDRLGMLSFDAWRASRLVVDTGLHAFGWSRSKAVDFLFANTLLAHNNCQNEVDRYIAWPGQALAYKIGQREILQLRAEAEEALGAQFDLREFHDRVLEHGAVPLSVLRERIEAWIANRPADTVAS